MGIIYTLYRHNICIFALTQTKHVDIDIYIIDIDCFLILINYNYPYVICSSSRKGNLGVMTPKSKWSILGPSCPASLPLKYILNKQ